MAAPSLEPPASDHSMQHRALLNIKTHLFGRDSIVHTINVMLKGLYQYNKDPVTHLIVLLCREPLTLCFTEHGLAPLQSDPTIIMPYSQMTKQQLSMLMDITKDIHLSGAFATTSQMGGGVYLYSLESSRSRVFADAVLLLFSINVVMRNPGKSQVIDSRFISNIVLQRILSNVSLPREVVTRAETMIRELAPAQA
tara:strand:+ start:122 stop:709 length:588 start_codon:yes stop_codon:yes gene_type:complete